MIQKDFTAFFLIIFMGMGFTPGFAAEEKKANPAPSNGTPSVLSEPHRTDDMTYAAKMKYRKEREEYNATVKAYNEIMKKKAEAEETPGAQAVPLDETFYQEEEKLRQKKSESKKKALQQKRVLVS